MGGRFDSALPTHAEFEKAMIIAGEGRERHGLYAIEDAEAIIQPIAKFYWRQLTLNLIPVLATSHVWAALQLPWYMLLVGIVGGALIVRAITLAPFFAGLFAPLGYRADDVARASSMLFSISTR